MQINLSREKYDEVAQRLQEIEERDGLITPAAVVADAERGERSPFYSLMEWDDAVAARQHRLATARAIIRAVQMPVRDERVELVAVAYVRPPSERGYRPLEVVKTEAEAARETLEAEQMRVVAMVNRAYAVSVGLGLRPDFERFLGQLVDQVTERSRGRGRRHAPAAAARPRSASNEQQETGRT